MSIQGPTNYQHPWPNYQLNDLHQAMDYNSAGQPIIRVSTASSGYGNTVVNGSTAVDAFGRQRISEPVTLFDSQNRYYDGEQFSSATTGAGSVTYNVNGSNFTLAVGTASGDRVVRQTRRTMLYQPGKSLQILNTFAFATLQTNLRQRVGYFTTGDGIFFEADGEDLYMVIRSSVTGSPVDNRVAQADWNQDKFDGTGPSGITLDPTKVQIWWCDIEWLGVGSVRTGFVINGVFYICHVFNHANIIYNVYMTTAILNPRYEIENTGTAAASSSMLQVCSTVVSEGGYTPKAALTYVPKNSMVTRIAAGNVNTAICSVRLNPANADAVVLPGQLDLLLVDVRYGEFSLVRNANIGNVAWSNIAGTSIQYAITSNVVSDGTVLYGGVTSSRDEVSFEESVKARLQLGRDATGTPDTLTLTVQYTANNADVIWKFGLEELSS